jgi:23S rRNA (cytosine1962-C5)-methyltransferase
MQISGKIKLRKGKELSIKRFHPWVFSGAIQVMEGEISDGCWVEVSDYRNQTLGFGHYQDGSIAIRILSFGQEAPGPEFWANRFEAALHLRNASGLPAKDTNAFRLVHAEGDGLPGLIIDFYDGNLVLQSHSAGMHNDRENIAKALREVLGDRCAVIYYRNQITLPGKKKLDFADQYLSGAGVVPHVIVEHGSKYKVDWESGQKTGFFLDQRENRRLLKNFCQHKAVLNTFCYTGGFSIAALEGGAQYVHSVDASEKAIQLTRANLALNGFDTEINTCYTQDTFDFLFDKKDVYDVIVLDPPAFAKHRDARHQAIKGYQRLNAEAMRLIRKGGILFTFSCSQVVDRQLFYNTIVSSAIQAGRSIKVLHHLSQPPDHPVSLFHPEGEYLKGLVLYVE